MRAVMVSGHLLLVGLMLEAVEAAGVVLEPLAVMALLVMAVMVVMVYQILFAQALR